MTECPHIPECAFYNNKLATMPDTSEFIKVIICHQKAETCLRLKNSTMTPVNEASNNIMPIKQPNN